MSDRLAIGEVATGAGATVVAVRYYADRGLVVTSGRVGGQRRFPPSAVHRVRFIRRCQEAGFSLDEIGALLDDDATDWRTLVDGKLAELCDRRDRLDETIELLTELRTCGCASVDRCDRILPT